MYHFADINECEGDTNICESSCNNTFGSFECGCKVGYTLSSNRRTCIGRFKTGIIMSRVG